MFRYFYFFEKYFETLFADLHKNANVNKHDWMMWKFVDFCKVISQPISQTNIKHWLTVMFKIQYKTSGVRWEEELSFDAKDLGF